jgi:hypothetical protein
MAVGGIHIKRIKLGGHEKILDAPKNIFGEESQPEFSHSVLKCGLDDSIGGMGLPQPKYLKFDVDGAEDEVVKGSRGCLKK